MLEVILLKIPFRTKYYELPINNTSWHKMKGFACFAFDIKNKKIINEYLKLDFDVNYKLTDLKHKEQQEQQKGYYDKKTY